MEENTLYLIKPKKNYSSLSNIFLKSPSKTIVSRNTAITPTISTDNPNLNKTKSICNFSKIKISTFQITTIDQEKENQSFNLFTHTNGLRMLKSRSYKPIKDNEKIKKELSDDFIFKELFNKNKNPRNKAFLNNKINKESIFDKKYRTLNSYLTNKASQLKRVIYIKDKVNEIQNKLHFIQGVTNIVYPKLVIKKLNEKTKLLYNYHFGSHNDLTPYKLNEIWINERNKKLTDYFTPSISILNKSKSVTWLNKYK